ncbi:MAG: hypothetical protein ACK4TA_20480 [Saprospiraceae bacterium]
MIDRTNEPNEPTVDRTQETTAKTSRRAVGLGILLLAGAGFFFFAPALAFIGGSVVLMGIAAAVVAGLVYLVYRLIR